MAKFVRWLKHWLRSPRAVERAFDAQALQAIEAAIAQAERSHRGEIRFAVEAALPWSYLKRDAGARERAAMLFAKLRVWDTEERNGVLIYVELADRGIEIVADRGIARQVSSSQWQAVCRTMSEHFRRDEFTAGVVAAVGEIGGLLAQHFPQVEGAVNPDELSNKPVVLGR